MSDLLIHFVFLCHVYWKPWLSCKEVIGKAKAIFIQVILSEWTHSECCQATIYCTFRQTNLLPFWEKEKQLPFRF